MISMRDSATFPTTAFPAILAFLIFLSYSGTAYGATEYERQNMNQRANEALEKILSMEEFRGQNSQQSWWSRLIERIFNLLPDEMGWMSTVSEWVLYITAALVLISVFILIARRLRKLPSFASTHDVPTQTQRHVDPEMVKMQAYGYSRTGDYKRAIRYLYLALLLYLDKAGLLAYDVGKTDGEYLGEIHGSMKDEADRFVSLTLFFERKWYGKEESDAGDFQQCEEAFVRLTGSVSSL
jgi:hypothetical protein